MKEPLRLWMPDDKGEMQVTLLEDEHADQYVYLDDYRELESKLDEANRHAAELQRGKNEALDRLSACEKLLSEVRFDRDAERARVIAAEGRLRTLQTALQRIVDRRWLGYVEAQEIARDALDGDIAVETQETK